MYKLVIRGAFILIVLSVLVLILFRSRLPFGNSNTSFAVESPKEITKIEFSEGGKKLFLENRGEGWLVNGKLETRKSGILFILRILQDISIKSPVSPDLFDAEITAKNIAPVKVKVYEKRKLVKSYLVYKTQSNKYGNIMKMRERSKPFIVYVPGFEGDIGSGFTLNELFWQPYTVFNFLPSEIASVKLENLSDTSFSFSIVNKRHHFTLSGSSGEMHGWDSTLVERYLSYFAYIPFEKWAIDLDETARKNIVSRQPLYRISVLTSDGRKSVLTLWEKMAGEEDASGKDSDRLLGKTLNSEEFFVMRYFDIDPLLKKRSYFFPE